MKSKKHRLFARRLLLSACLSVGMVGTSLAQTALPARPALPASVWAVTESNELIQFNATAPNRILQRKALKGLAANDALVGIDYRVSRGVLFGLTQSGRLVTINTATGELQAVGTGALALPGRVMGFDFNPAADRIRVVSPAGQNLRLHPDTGALVDFDPAMEGIQTDPMLQYVPGDINAGKKPDIVAAGYTYNQQNPKVTTNYAIDRTQGTLVMQGSLENVQPVVSPNLGLLTTVGMLGVGQVQDASFDISDIDNIPLAAIRTDAIPQTRLYRLNLQTGQATVLGIIGRGEVLTGLAIEP